MPRLTARSRKPKPNVVYFAWQGFSSDNPPGTEIQRGTRLRGDNEIVQRHSRNFVETAGPNTSGPPYLTAYPNRPRNPPSSTGPRRRSPPTKRWRRSRGSASASVLAVPAPRS